MSTKNLYFVEWKTTAGWGTWGAFKSLKKARFEVRRLWANWEPLGTRITRWVRPSSPGVHGWMKETQ